MPDLSSTKNFGSVDAEKKFLPALTGSYFLEMKKIKVMTESVNRK